MRGSVRQKSKNSWQIQIYTGKGPDGTPQRHFETVKGRKGDAQRRLTELLSSLDKGVYTPPGKLTVGEHLRNWLNSYVKANCAPRTIDSYRSTIENHLIPGLGHHTLKDLKRQAINEYYAKALDKPLSAKSVRYHHRILSHALKDAIEQGILGINPCDSARPPKADKKKARTWELSEVATLLDAASDSQFYPVIYMALSTGLRQGELLALRWRDLDLNKRSISVSRTFYKRQGVAEFRQTKTSHSSRYVSMTPKLAAYLREYREERESLFLHFGRLLRRDDLVFCNSEGEPLDPSVLSHSFQRIVKIAGLENLRFHDLRHGFASLMFHQGAKPKVISEALGHASVAFTMDVYSHIIQGMQEEAMELLNEVMPPGVNGKRE